LSTCLELGLNKPGSATLPNFGVCPVILDEKGNELQGECEGYLALSQAWPSSIRTIYGDHPIKGQGIWAYVTLIEGIEYSGHLKKELAMVVRETIGPFAAPDVIHWAPGLPKTRSGKIMRRVLRKIAAYEEDQLGDVSMGNGGLTLRSISLMKSLAIEVSHMASNSTAQEDFIYSYLMESKGSEKMGLAPRNEAYRFAVEVPCTDIKDHNPKRYKHGPILNTMADVPLGLHATWYYFNSKAYRNDLLWLLELSVC
jgi:hypothetical protein